tara:strand:- start:426 stop:1319 length:894 start_codon:yes stop_codon:yes gene_type:complete
MADRFPLIVNTGHDQIQELPSGDNLNLSNNSIVGVGTVTATTVNATTFVGDGSGLTGVASTDNIRTNTNATFLQNVNVSGTVTATSYSGSGANLTSLPAANLTGDLPAISGANLTGISAGMTLVGVTTVGATGGSPTSFEFTSLDPDSLYYMNGWLRLASTGAQFLAQAQMRQVHDNNFYNFGDLSAYESSTKTMNTDYGNQSSSYWYFYNNYTLSNELWFDMTISTYTYPWVRVNYGGGRQSYTTTWGSGNGAWTSNASGMRIEGIKLYNSYGSGYNQPTRVHLYKLQTTGVGTHY